MSSMYYDGPPTRQWEVVTEACIFVPLDLEDADKAAYLAACLNDLDRARQLIAAIADLIESPDWTHEAESADDGEHIYCQGRSIITTLLEDYDAGR